MADKLSIADLSRQPLVRGTSCFTDPQGNVGYKNEDIQLSALVRIAAALEAQAQVPKLLQLLSFQECAELFALSRECQQNHYDKWVGIEYGIAAGEGLLRLCHLVDKLLAGSNGNQQEGGQDNG